MDRHEITVLVRRLRYAAANEAIDIGTARGLLSLAADTLSTHLPTEQMAEDFQRLEAFIDDCDDIAFSDDSTIDGNGVSDALDRLRSALIPPQSA